MRTGSVIAVVAVAAALVALLVYGVASQGADTSIDEAVERGDRPSAPEASLPVLGDQGSGSLGDYRGQVVVLNFWASWCPPCVDELPLLERTQRRIEPRGATVLGVNYQDLPEDATRFVDRFGLTFPNVRDRDGEYADEYAILGFPETFVIDRKGRIAAARRGPVTAEWLESALSPLLGGGKA
ncbi:MAG TPA: TlpA disulfide reductase family protein [Thermoleophilaceae bacterium]|nr:TlpA family protein disulfide reductase [Actinomycetota bacterium]HYN52867.1 TlpA disulfide reductase family protein [Thermoleophilaceae bacterium]